MATTTLDLRRALADKPRDLPPLEFDLTGAEALVNYIRPHTDAIRERADEEQQGRDTP